LRRTVSSSLDDSFGRSTLTPEIAAADALFEVGRWLQDSGYFFTTVTPETHRRNNARASASLARDLRDVFGWNRPFERTLLPSRIVHLLDGAGALKTEQNLLTSGVRYSTLDDNLFLHSSYPTVDDASVFFGPDSYRFTRFVARELKLESPPSGARLVDIGCGTGVAGLLAAQLIDGANVVLTDINERALEYARVNAALAGFERVEFVNSDILSAVEGDFDLVIANPPYMADPLARAYRDGGAHVGAALSLRILKESLTRLRRGGRLLLYTGAAVIAGHDVFLEHARTILGEADIRFRYEEIDPDVFGEELDEPPYADVERIAAVGLVAYAN
jgi:release factor glutamine methyltransferase